MAGVGRHFHVHALRQCFTVYLDRRDWWVGYYRGQTHHYVCPLPTVVIRWNRWKRQ